MATLKHLGLSSYGVMLTPSSGSAISRCVSCEIEKELFIQLSWFMRPPNSWTYSNNSSRHSIPFLKSAILMSLYSKVQCALHFQWKSSTLILIKSKSFWMLEWYFWLLLFYCAAWLFFSFYRRIQLRSIIPGTKTVHNIPPPFIQWITQRRRRSSI